MPHITLPCSVCGQRTDWECSSCRQPVCHECLREWPAAHPKPGSIERGYASRGYRCVACAQGLREPVKVKRQAAPIVTRRYTCGNCREVIHTSVTRRWTRNVQRGLSDEEKVNLLYAMHRRERKCTGPFGLGCEYEYQYPTNNDPRNASENREEKREEVSND